MHLCVGDGGEGATFEFTTLHSQHSQHSFANLPAISLWLNFRVAPPFCTFPEELPDGVTQFFQGTLGQAPGASLRRAYGEEEP